MEHIPVDLTMILQVCVFPLIGALWLSLTKRIDRLEVKVDRMPTRELCASRHQAADQRLVRLEKIVNHKDVK